MKNLWILLTVMALSAFSCSEPDSVMNDGLYSKADGLYGLTNNGYSGGEGDQYTDFGENPFINASEDPVSTFGIDADGASYANMRGYESDGYRIPPEAVRVEEFINYFNFDYPDPSSEHVSINSETAVCPWNTEHYLLRIGLKGRS
jgi:Ca-activated chloride channel family protein